MSAIAAPHDGSPPEARERPGVLAGLRRTLRREPVLPTPGQRGRVAMSAVGVTVMAGGRPIVDAVDLEARHGEVLALVGPNGAGKSTLLAALAGDLRPSAGSVELDGRPVSSWSTRELAMRRAVLTQQVSVSFPFTVEQVVRMGRAAWAGTSLEDQDDRAVAAAMATTGVQALSGRVITSLSGGERSLSALARVLAQGVDTVLLDEPTAALDVHHQELVLDVATRLATQNVAVVVVLHDLGLAAAHADRIAVLDGGRLRCVGPPSEVMTEQLLSDVYRCPVEVVVHPRTGALLIVPVRDGSTVADRTTEVGPR